MQFSNRSNISNTMQDMVRTYNDQLINAAYQKYRGSQPSIPSDQPMPYQNATKNMINRDIISIIYKLIRKIQQEQNAISVNNIEETTRKEQATSLTEKAFSHTPTDLFI